MGYEEVECFLSFSPGPKLLLAYPISIRQPGQGRLSIRWGEPIPAAARSTVASVSPPCGLAVVRIRKDRRLGSLEIRLKFEGTPSPKALISYASRILCSLQPN